MNRYKERLYFVALKMVGNHEDADDISQEAFIKAYTGLSSFRGDSSFYTWIYRIVVNLSINHRKKKKLRQLVSIDEMLTPLRGPRRQNPEQALENAEVSQEIKKAVDELPERQRTVFILRQFEGLSHQEIAEIVGRSEGAVKANYFHAVKKLQRYLKKVVDPS